MKPTRISLRACVVSLLLALGIFLCFPTRCFAENLIVPPGTTAILDKIYSFNLEAAMADARHFQEERPGHPLGYLLEAEARWWKIWCLAAEYKWGMNDAHHRAKLPSDDRYLELSLKALSLAESSLKEHESADMHFYAGMAQAALARLYGLRAENRATARAGVRGREHFLRALALNPDLADADFGLGLYNYYVDTLSSFVKFLGFFMGIPGGNKRDGIRQLQHAMADGVITPAAARFYLAMDLHRYDQQYEQALALIGPLAEKYPSNPLFQLARGDLYGKLARKPQAMECYRLALAADVQDEECRAHIRELVRASLAAQDASLAPAAPAH
jgi:tetratricopeptide (TPR) repeat protein